MRISRFKLYTAVALIAISSSSCRDNFEDINANPNQMEIGSIRPSSMLTPLIYNSADLLLYNTWYLNGELIQYSVSSTSTNAYHRYVIPNGTTASIWSNNSYCSNNAKEIYNLAGETKEINYKAIALTMFVLNMSNQTDCFGDMPYTDALKIEQGLTKPRFDSQKAIYSALFDSLEVANSMYIASKALSSPEKDILYGGNIAQWKKFNNSLYLRLLMRVINRSDEISISGMTAAEKISDIFDNPSKYPIFASNDDNAVVKYSGVTPFTNRFGNDTEASFNGRAAAENIINIMDAVGDPRLSIYFVQSGSQWKGSMSGMPSDESDNSGSAHLNKKTLGSYTSPYAFMKYDELLFIKCEALLRNIIPGGEVAAEPIYNDAIRASIKYWDAVSVSAGQKSIPDGTIDQLLAKVAYSHDLETIMTQKHIALFWVGFEAWHEYRRTGFPSLTIGTGVKNDGILPRRFFYPYASQSTNPDNYAAEVAILRAKYFGGGDNMVTPVWWSKEGVELERQ